MKVHSIAIRNILGIESLEVKPGSVTLIEGANATGKTSVLDALRSAFDGSHDATLLRQGAEEGEIVLVLDDGTEVKKTVSPGSSAVSVKHPTFGKISKPATYLKKLSDALSLNPIEFLTAPAKERVDLLLKAVPMSVTADQLSFVPVAALNGISLDGHALEVIGKIARSIYDLRTGVNRACKEKQATAKQMAETLPAEPPNGNWKQELDNTLAESSALQRATSAQVGEIKSVFVKARDVWEGRFNQHKGEVETETRNRIDQLRAEFEREVEKVKADGAIEIESSRQKTHDLVQQAQDSRDSDLKALEAEFRPKEAALKERIGHARAMVEQHTKAESTREFIAQLGSDAAQLDAEATKLTHSLGQLEILKSSLLEKLPIEGLEVRDGDIYIGGLPFDRVNESRKIRLAIEIAKLRAGSLGLVAVDGLERLDSAAFKAFAKQAAKSGLQFVIAKVTDAPSLSVSSDLEQNGDAA